MKGDSENAYIVVFYVLGSIDAALFLISTALLVRLFVQSHKSDYHFLAKKTFHAVIALCMLVRSVYWLMSPTIIYGPLDNSFPYTLFAFWNFCAALLFGVAYGLLLLFWVNFYYQLQGLHGSFFRTAFFIIAIITGAVVAIVAVVLTVLLFVWANDDNKIDLIESLYVTISGSFLLIIAAGFLFYGIQLYRLLQNFPALRDQTKRKSLEMLVFVAIVCTLCFTMRAVTTIVLAFTVSQNQNDNRAYALSWWLTLMIYLFGEVLPVCCMLFFLRKLPKVRRPHVQVPASPIRAFQHGTLASPSLPLLHQQDA